MDGEDVSAAFELDGLTDEGERDGVAVRLKADEVVVGNDTSSPRLEAEARLHALLQDDPARRVVEAGQSHPETHR